MKHKLWKCCIAIIFLFILLSRNAITRDSVDIDLVEENFEIKLLGNIYLDESKQVKDNLEAGNDSNYNSSGDELTWNVIKTNANKLHNENIKGKGIKVAVFDTGIDLNNSELNVIGGTSCVDGTTSYDDDNGHGTAMAGILAARLNGKGIAGIAPEVELYSVKVLDKDGIGKYGYIIQGIEWAIENDMNIITLSLGGTQYSQILKEAIDLAVANDILIIASAGNGRTNQILYPAAYSQVICVGATDSNDKLTELSNYGPQLDIVAPGANVNSIGLNNTKVTVDGTSPGSQHVAGVAALVWSANPQLTSGEIKYLLYNNAHELGDYNTYGYGLVDAEASYKSLLKGNYSAFISDENEDNNVEKTVDAGREGVVTGQACRHPNGLTGILSTLHEGTCIAEGSIQARCARCGYTQTINTGYGAHKESLYNIDATCNSGKYALIVCNVCGASRTIPLEGGPLGHNYTSGESLSHTPGYGHYWYSGCTRCSSGSASGYHNYDYSNTSSTHTADGHYYETGCSKCNLVYSSGYKTLANCLSCTTPPSVSFNNMDGNTVLSEQNAVFYPQIRVYDNENDTLSCNYYLDGSAVASGTTSVTGTKPELIVTFPAAINVLSLSEGTHTIRITVKDSITPLGETSLTFRVDKAAPVISSITADPTTSSVKLTAYAVDSITGLSANAYRYTIGGISTDWITTNYYNLINLTADTNYNYKVEVRDNLGHIAESVGSFSTKVEKPTVTAAALSENKLLVIIKDKNPTTTLYKIQIGNGYVNSDGVITSSENWITLYSDPMVGGKIINLSNLYPNTEYNVVVSAKNVASGEVVISNNMVVTTSPSAPTNVVVNVKSNNSIQVLWDTVPGAISYELYRETLSDHGAVLTSKTVSNIISNSCYDSNIIENQIYRYKLRSMNQSGIYGNWTDFVVGSTLPTPPVKVTGVIADIDGSTLNLTWDAITGVVGYEVEVVYDGKVWTKRFMINNATFDTSILNCQCSIRVRAFNVSDDIDVTKDTFWRNSGEWSNSKIFYTEVNIPIMKEIATEKITPNSVELQWLSNGNPDSVQYKIGVFKDNQLIKETAYTTSLKSIITDLISETDYTFKVRARNLSMVETEWSNEVDATMLIDYPSVPSSLRATAKTDKIILNWNDSVRAQSYQIERNGTIIAIDYQTNTYIDEDVTDDTKYSYRVNAVNTTGESGWSYVLDTKTLSNLPDTPTITAVTGSSISLTINWSPVDRTDGYDIEVDGDIYNTDQDTIYEHNGMLPGSYHTYRVRGRNVYGMSDWCAPFTIKTTPNVPGIPINISETATDKQILLKWDAVSDANFYDIEINGEIHNNVIASEYLHTAEEEAIPGAQYIIRVRAVNEGGASEWSVSSIAVLLVEVEGNIPITSIPKTPTAVCSVSGSSIVWVKWEKCQDATVYQVEADNTIIYTGANIEFAHTGSNEKTAHTYRVRAGNITGYSEWSNPIRITTDAANINIPQNVNFYRKSDGLTTIIWDNVKDVSEYCIEVNGVKLNTIINDTKVDITTIPGELYNIRIAAVRKVGSKKKLDWSDVITFRAPRKLPVAPVLKKTTATSNTITASWYDVSDAYGYEVEIDGKIINNNNSEIFTQNNLESSMSYTIRVRAYNESGASDWSVSKTVMTDEGILGIPVNIIGGPYATVSSATGSAIMIQWDNMEGASSYEVEDANGQISSTLINKIIIDNLIPGEKYDFRVRAVTNSGAGAWSSKITFMPVVTTPVNVNIQVVDGKIHLTWDKVGGSQLYEIEIDGVTYTTTASTSIVFDYSIFYTQRSIRVRACYAEQRSDWSQNVIFDQVLPITIELYKGELISVLLPVKNAEIGKYILTLQYSTDEIQLLDACEITPDIELATTYMDELNTYIVIDKKGSIESITYIIECDEYMKWSGIASSIKFISKITGTVTLKYSVKLK